MQLDTGKYKSRVLGEWLHSRPGSEGRAGISAILPENGAIGNLTADQLASLLGSTTRTASGVAVTPEAAMRVATVYGCVSLLAGVVSSLPFTVYERTTDGGRKKAQHDYWWMLNERANEECSANTAMQYFIASRLFYGDGFGLILRPSAFTNKATGWRPLHPSRVQPFRDSEGQLYYRVSERNGNERVYDKADILHVPSLGFDGLRSPSPITYAAREAIGTSLAAEEFSSRLFSQGSTHDIALKTKTKLSTDQADVLRASYIAKYGGGKNSRVPLILTGGMEVEKLSINPVDAGLLPTRQFSVEEICRIFGVPPFLMGATDKTTSWGTGMGVIDRGFVKYTLRGRHLDAIEQEFNYKLWPNRERYFLEFNTSAFERDDLKTRMEAYRTAVGRAGEPGWMTPDEARRLENMEPIAGGDKLHSGEPTKGSSNGSSQTAG